MTDQSSIRSQVKSIYVWLEPGVTKISAAVERSILPFFGSDSIITASLSRGSAPSVRQTHKSFDSWSTALSSEWELFEIELNSSDWSRHASIQFDLNKLEIRVSFDMVGADAEPLSRLLGNFQSAMSLGNPRPVPQSIPKPKARLDGQYHVERPEDVAWFQKLLTIVETWVGQQVYFNGSFSLLTAPQFRSSPTTYLEWKAQCINNWKDILDLTASITGEQRDCAVRCYGSYRDLGVTLSSQDTNELAELFKVLQKELPILPSKNPADSGERASERRRYFAADQIDSEWFDRCTELFHSIPKGKVSFTGRFRTAVLKMEEREAVHDEEDFLRTNYEAWRAEVRSKWNDLLSFSFSISSPDISITTDIDLLRDVVNIQLQSTSELTNRANFEMSVKSLNLKQFRGDPYRYRRFLRRFKIRRWTGNQAFADAVKAAIHTVFPSRVPGQRLAIAKAFVAVGNADEDLEPYGNYEDFYKRIAAGGEFTRSVLILEGPLGRLLGIELDREKNNLTIRTSVDRSELPKLILPFDNAIELKLEESKDAPEEKKSEANTITKPILLAAAVSVLGVLISASISVLTSERGLRALSKHYSLEIIYPKSQSGAPVSFAGQELRVQWKLIEQTITGDHADLHSQATISVLREGSAQPHRYPGSDGAQVVNLTPGKYNIQVVSDVDHSSEAHIDVVVPEPKAPGTSESSNSKVDQGARKTRR